MHSKLRVTSGGPKRTWNQPKDSCGDICVGGCGGYVVIFVVVAVLNTCRKVNKSDNTKRNNIRVISTTDVDQLIWCQDLHLALVHNNISMSLSTVFQLE